MLHVYKLSVYWSDISQVTPNLCGCLSDKKKLCTVFKETPTSYILEETL